MNDIWQTEKETICFYEEHAHEYAEATVSVDMSIHRKRFMEKLKEHAYVLDFGCGSGRDAKSFLDYGYKVDAIDGCERLCQIAADYTGIEVKRMMFHEFSASDQYDGIWACASLLHLPYAELESILIKLKAALKDNGILYASFKHGNEEKVIDGKHYTNMDIAKLEKIVHNITGMSIENIWYSSDLMPGRKMVEWINVIARKGKD